jgi:hypothetical protein
MSPSSIHGIRLARGALALAIAAAAGSALAAADNLRFRFSPGMTSAAAAGRPDSDWVELPNQGRIRVGDWRRLDAAAQRMRAPQRGAPPGLRAAPAPSGTPVRDSAELQNALRLPGTQTIQLPSGRRLTAEQLRALEPQIEKRLGHRLSETTAARPGAVIKVDARSDWAAILKRPDNTVLESPSGKRITVSAVKREMAKSDTGPTTARRP